MNVPVQTQTREQPASGLNLCTPSELTANYGKAGITKTAIGVSRMIMLGFLAGMLIAFGSAAANTVSHSVNNVSLARLISGLLFPFGLAMVILLGAELFTGNCLIVVSVLERKTSMVKMLKNWLFVYAGNIAGALFVAFCCAYFNQLDYSSGGLAAYTIKVAAAKCALPFGSALVLGILCNILVCAGILCSLSAKDTAGRVLGAYIPVLFFVVCGFEHCVANMYFIPAGLFALDIPAYSAKAAAAGIDVSGLSWGSFVLKNLIPVTIGNIIGGAGLGALMWANHVRKK